MKARREGVPWRVGIVTPQARTNDGKKIKHFRANLNLSKVKNILISVFQNFIMNY